MNEPDLPCPRDAIPAWAEFIAQDRDGAWWAYEAEPNQNDNGWYENEVGRIQRLGLTTAPDDCHTTLIKVSKAG